MEFNTVTKKAQGACGPQIAQTAVQSIGISTGNFGAPLLGPPEYARAVSLIFTKATEQTIILGTPPDHVCSTSILWNSLAHDKRFEQVPMSQAAPGDILIEPGWQKAADGYAGIVVGHGRIVSNSNQGVRDDTSLSELQRQCPNFVVFHYVGFRNYCHSKPLANQHDTSNEPRVPAGQSTGGEWTDGGSDISEGIQEKLWSRNNPKYRAAIAAVAWSHKGDKKWLKTGKFTNKCNLAVSDWVYEATGSSPSYKGRAPLAHEWADPNVKIEGWSAPFPVSKAQPGDVIAQDHGGGNGHVGIVVGPQKTASADAKEHPAGIVFVNDWGFRSTAEENGGKPGGPMPVVRRYVGY